MRRLVWLGLMLFTASFTFGQPHLDSLKKLFRESQRVKDGKENYHLYDIALAFYRFGLYDSAIHYHERMLINKPGDDIKASALNGIGVAYIAMGRTDKSIGYLTSAITIYDQLRDTTNYVTNLANLAIIYKDMGLYDKALDNAFLALSKLEHRKPDRALASCYNTIGTVYLNTTNFEKSYEYYRKALLVRQQAGLESGVGQSYNNLGELFIAMRIYDSALFNLRRAAEAKQKLGDEKSLARTHTNIGKVLVRMQRLADAEQQFAQASEIQAKVDDMLGRVETHNALAELNIIREDWSQARMHLAKARETSKLTRNPERFMSSLELETRLHKNTGNYRQLAHSLEELLAIRDSIHSIEKEKILLSMEAQYETEKKVQQITFLESEVRLKQVEAERQWMTIASLGLLVAFAGTAAVMTWKRRRQVELHTREMHHRIKNNLQMLTSMLTIQSDLAPDERTAQMIRSTEGRVNAMALIHKKLYRSANAQDIQLKEYISEVIQYLVYSYGFAQRDLVLDLHVDEITLDVDKSIVIGLVMNELVSNAFKHAIEAVSDPQLGVSLRIDKQQIVITVSDNGPKALTQAEFDRSTSFGLLMVKKLIKDLKGTIILSDISRTAYTITIPN